MNIIERKQYLEAGNELQLAIEGKDTNLRIWVSNTGNGGEGEKAVFIRLDQFEAYSCPLNLETVQRVENPAIHNLAKWYTFPCSLSDLDRVMGIVGKLKERKVKPW